MATLIDQLIVQANSGDPQACFDLYQEFLHGIHVDEDNREAQEWLEKAIDYNHPTARLIQEADLLLNGFIDEGVELLRSQCDQKVPDAFYILGQLYLNNVVDVDMPDMDVEKGFEYLTRAAELGSTEAQLFLGKCFYNGLWVPRDKFTARYWMNQAQSGGSYRAEMLYNETCREITQLN